MALSVTNFLLPCNGINVACHVRTNDVRVKVWLLEGAWLHCKMAICLDYQGPTLDEILLRHGLKATDLERLCPLEVRNEVAILIKDWEMVGHCLNFAPEKIRDIDRENRSQDQCKVALLDTWSKREGKGATYLKLADVFHRRKRRDLVELLCEKVKSSMRLVPLSGTPDASLDISTTVKPHHISIAKGLYMFVGELSSCCDWRVNIGVGHT